MVWHPSPEAALYAALPSVIGRGPTADEVSLTQECGYFVCLLDDGSQLHGWITPGASYLEALGETASELARVHAESITTHDFVGAVAVLAADLMASSPFFAQATKQGVRH
ncbi:hypothetical protein CCO03_17035 [Comamonas serinivorans]|uniref:Uncharacterized protein n=1 Tax=Comamonas serinivorans TaxID=1082851 RepID=A0A1Y0ERY3_9BURK|nr:hypothetical protein CCO03_17035 [Comamonas serinivorans]